MRSVVVVLPASMWAMMPMLRVRARGYSRTSSPLPFLTSWSVAATFDRSSFVGSAGALPAVVREGAVGLRHLVHVLAPLDRGARTVGGVHDLGAEALGHRVLATGAREVHEPAHRERRAALRLDLDRHLVGGASDAAGLHLEERADVVDRLLQGDHRVVRGLLADLLERVVDDLLGRGLLAVQQDPVDQLRHEQVLIDRVGLDGTTYGRAFARHG